MGLVLEKLGVGHADVRKDSNGGADDVGEGLHLVRFGYSGFENGQVVLLRHLPYGERNANLGIVAVGTSHNIEIVAKQRVEPLFDDGFAIGAGDADDGVVELRAVAQGEGVEGGEGVGYNEEITVGVKVDRSGVGDHKVVHARLGEGRDEAVAVVLRGSEGEEQGMLRLPDFPAVEAEADDVGTVIADDALQRVDYMGNLGNSHF